MSNSKIQFFDTSVAMPTRQWDGYSRTVLAVTKPGYMMSACYNWKEETWVSTGVSEAFADETIPCDAEIKEEVTHWATLPNPFPETDND